MGSRSLAIWWPSEKRKEGGIVATLTSRLPYKNFDWNDESANAVNPHFPEED
jgi:hypothetical protein